MVKYDAHNKIMCIQWVDNKVVSCLSTLQLSGEYVCSCRSGSNILHLSIPKALKTYQQGMGAVDRCDQYQERVVQENLHAILDFMLVNSFFTLNMSVPEVEGMLKVTRQSFMSPYLKK